MERTRNQDIQNAFKSMVSMIGGEISNSPHAGKVGTYTLRYADARLGTKIAIAEYVNEGGGISVIYPFMTPREFCNTAYLFRELLTHKKDN